MEPLRIREGGVSFLGDKLLTYRAHLIIQSIPSVPYLEKEFSCRALHLPMGQSSVGSKLIFFVLFLLMNQDQAHLPNERISIKNLRKGKAVIERFLLKVSQNNSPN